MGSNFSKLKKSLEHGDEQRALEIYNKNQELRSKLDANAIVNEYSLDTYMHVCAKHGMIDFLKLLLHENNGNPNKSNKHSQTVMHKVCQGQNDAVQYECMKLLLDWRCREDPNNKKIDINNTNFDLIEINVNAKDENENTPLHYAAMKNLLTCVQTLVAHGAYLFVENFEHSTPCDLAERNGHKDIALYLESKMIFSKDDFNNEYYDNEDDDLNEQEICSIDDSQGFGIGIEELQKEKYNLLVKTAQALNCNIFTAEILLKKFSWSKESLLYAWREDSAKFCENCSVSIETNDFLVNDLRSKNNNNIIKSCPNDQITYNKSNHKNIKIESHETSCSINQVMGSKKKRDIKKQNEKSISLLSTNGSLNKIYCMICYLNYDSNEPKLDLTESNDSLCKKQENFTEQTNKNHLFQAFCGHEFCRDCWKRYLTIKIDEGCDVGIVCPQHDCDAILPNNIIEQLVSAETAHKYSQLDLKAFVDSNPKIKWCPFPGCGMAVRDRKLASNTQLNLSNKNERIDQNKSSMNSNANSKKDDHSLNVFVADSSEYSIRSVDCGAGHYFCWDCLKEGHEPASCKNWKDWFEKIKAIKPDEIKNTNEKEELSANYLWLVTNSKLCPNSNCNAPIQKNEGCNHIKCSKCKHDFCWICMESWKKHSSATGGYFQCNRYEVSQKVNQKEKENIAQAEETYTKAAELNKFVHYYTRFKNHENSYKLEEPLLQQAKRKFETLIAQPQQSSNLNESQHSLYMHREMNNNNNNSKQHFSILNLINVSKVKEKNELKNGSMSYTLNTDNDQPKTLSYRIQISEQPILRDESKIEQKPNEKNSKAIESSSVIKKEKFKSDLEPHLFIEEAIRELLKSRRILRCSYVYGYYLDSFGHKKFIFELIQTEFEECTENLSQAIARPHLKTPKNKIIRLTNMLKRKRVEFLETIRRGLNNFKDTPPTLKKYSRQRWKYLLKDNIQIEDEFKNTIALSIKELNPKNPWIVDKKGRHTNLLSILNDWPELEQDLESILKPNENCLKPKKQGDLLCAKWDCSNVRAVNTLSGKLCNYCSIRCMKLDHLEYMEQKINSSEQQKLNYDRNMNFKQSSFDSNKTTSNSSLDQHINRLKYILNNDDIQNAFSDNLFECEIEKAIHINIQGKYKNNESQPRTSRQVFIENEFLEFEKENINHNSKNVKNNKNNRILEIKNLPFYTVADENEISVILKNLKIVLCDEQSSKKKTEKVCNFKVTKNSSCELLYN